MVDVVVELWVCVLLGLLQVEQFLSKFVMAVDLRHLGRGEVVAVLHVQSEVCAGTLQDHGHQVGKAVMSGEMEQRWEFARFWNIYKQ